MALFWGIQEYIALNANNITLVFDSGNIVNISGNIFLYPPQGHPILYKSSNCYGGHLGFRKLPQINSVRGLSGIKVISKCEFNLTSGFQSTAFTSNILHMVQC